MWNEDKWQKRENEIFREEQEKLREIEKERAFLKDKSIGQSNAPRPSDEDIDRNLGKPLNSLEIAQAAGEKAEQRLAQERAEAERIEARRREQELQREKPTRKLSEQFREARERQRGRGRSH